MIDLFAEEENWRPVLGYEGLYEVSDLERVRSVPRVVGCKDGGNKVLQGVMLKIDYNANNRCPNSTVHLSKNCVVKTHSVHVLVLEAFVCPRPDGMEGCHFPDPSHTNNRLDNLRWDTYAGNREDMAAHGTAFKRKTPVTGGSNPNAVLTAEKVLEIRRDYAAGKYTHKQLASMHGVCEASICHIVNRRTWKHV